MQNNHTKDKHIFAVYYKELGNSASLAITDKDIVARVVHVLRLQLNEEIILFDGKRVGTFIVVAIDKKMIKLQQQSMRAVEQPKQKMHVCVGLLKKESFEEVLYNATELGVCSIQPIISEKIHKNWWTHHYKERFEKILIAACEQSKNFNIPTLYEPITFEQYIKQQHAYTLWFDVTGDNIVTCLARLNLQQEIYMLIGPEGDFSVAEKDMLHNNNFIACRLTPTVLRSVQAVTVGVGAVHSILNT